MKILWIANLAFFPISDIGMDKHCTPKYIKGTISGFMMPEYQWTQAEIRNSWPDIKEAENLHDLCKQWGTML